MREAALHFHEYPEARESSRSSRPSRWATSATWRSPIRPASPRPARKSPPTPKRVTRYTSRGNLVAVISNGTAVLGLGAIGALASKPVMEGKAVLFKKFAGIDVFDIEIDERDPKKFIEVVAPLEPTFGGINLEDIKAPECFEIEEALRARMKIPVFHDDQHGTAIIVGAAVLNGLELAGKKIGDVKICTSGAGAAAIACLNMLVALGAKLENIWVADKDGLLTHKRNDVNDKWRGKFCAGHRGHDARRGVRRRRYLPRPLGRRRAEAGDAASAWRKNPLILALANPDPGDHAGGGARRCGPTPWSAPAARTIPTRSTTSSASPSSSAARSMSARPTINEEMKLAAVARHRQAGA